MSGDGREKGGDPIDAKVGDRVDVEETAQAISSGDIEAVVLSPEPDEKRRDDLRRMRGELEARVRSDPGHDLQPLIDEIDSALARIGRAPQTGSD